MSIPCPHFSISIRQRSKRQSAVAGAAYQSGEKLFSEYDQKTKNYAYKSGEVVAKGILLPPNAPAEYQDRETLWNAVEAAEKQWNAQLARNIIMAIPRELPKEEYENLIREYCLEQFVSRGMIADFAIHDKGDGNPHAHVLLTMRAMDEQGRWLPKARKVYDLDADGRKIFLPSGEPKSHKENTVDWNDRGMAEVWRSAWADTVNRYLEKHHIPERLDLRSYARQGKDQVPTIHLGPAATHLEAKGVRTELGDYNRQIIAHNKELEAMRRRNAKLSQWLTGLFSANNTLAAQKSQPTIADYIYEYQSLRKAGRIDWSRTSKQTAAVKDLKFASQVFQWMQKTGIYTLEDLNEVIAAQSTVLAKISDNKKDLKKLNTSIQYLETFERLRPIYEQSKKGFKSTQARYAEAHKEELSQYKKAFRYLKANDLHASDLEKCKARRAELVKETEALAEGLREFNLDPDLLEKIQYQVSKVLEVGVTPRHRESVLEKLEQAKTETREGQTPKDHARQQSTR